MSLPILPFDEQWLKIIASLKLLESTSYEVELSVYLLWYIWKIRNKHIFTNKYIDEVGTASVAVAAHSEFVLQQAHLHKLSQSVSLSRPESQTTHNDVVSGDIIKLTFDAATSKAKSFGVVAVIASDASHHIIAKFDAFFRNIWDPGILEFMALREALNWAAFKGWKRLILEGDALQVTQSINSHSVMFSATWGICQDIWRLLDRLQDYSLQHVLRKNNKEAHQHAQTVKHFVSTFL